MAPRWLTFLVLVVVFSGASVAQVTTGTISGTVRDDTGAVMPGVAVDIRNIDTGMGRLVNTDSRGHYTAPNLSLGPYEVTASLSGFQTEVRRGITLNVGQNAIIDFSLAVGSVTERVEVTAEAPLIETTSAVVSGLVNERQVQDLPLNARNLISLGTLQAGVAFSETGETSVTKGYASKLTISGTRYNSSAFQLDGANINDGTGSAGSATGILMGAETIREFNVIVNGYSAEFGQHSGGVFNAVTKSGTNNLHGSAFEFLRNDKLDAARWEENKFGVQKPAFKRNQFGGSLGGPIARDRSFFFTSYEGLRARESRVSRTFVPTERLRQGFVPNPATGVETKFDVHPQVVPYLNFYPLPTPGARVTEFGTAERIDTWKYPDREDFVTVRMDHKISDNDSLFGRYTFDQGKKTNGVDFTRRQFATSRNQYAAVGETRIFTTVINQLLVAFNRSHITDASFEVPEDLVIPPQFNWTGREGMIRGPSVSGVELQSFGPGSSTANPVVNILNTYQVRDDVSYVRDRHSLKFGFSGQRSQLQYSQPFNGMGAFAFRSLTDFMQGIVNSFTALRDGANERIYWRWSLFGLYAQDDFRLSPRLTLNLGLRYEFITEPFEKYGKVSNLPEFIGPGLTYDDLIIGNPTFLNPSTKNFAPRVGLAWNLTGSGKTSIRAGAGIFHDQINVGSYGFGFQSSPPFYEIGEIRTRGVARFPDAFFTQQDLLRSNSNIEGFEFKPSQPTVYKWSLDLQRQVAPNTGLTLGYSGTRGVHLIRVVSMNPRLAFDHPSGRGLFVPVNSGFANPAFARVRPRFADVTSDYHALRLSLQRRLSGGLQFQGAYTWSKTVDDASNFTGSTDFANSPGNSRYRDLKDRGLAAFDVRHNFTTNFTYQLPGSDWRGAAGWILGGWQTSGILALRSGTPFDVSSGVNPALATIQGASGVDVVAGAKFQYDTRNPNRYFDPSPFRLPPGFSLAEGTALGGAFIGNVGRGILIGPGSATFDFVLMKTIGLTERLNMQFRSEFFNLFNRANFGSPTGRIFADANGTPFSRTGEINSTRGSARQVQFGLKLEF